MADLQMKNRVLETQVTHLQKQLASAVCVPNKVQNPSDESLYMVRSIITHRIVNQKREFRVRWEGYGPRDDTWEPEGNVKKLTVFKNYSKKHFK